MAPTLAELEARLAAKGAELQKAQADLAKAEARSAKLKTYLVGLGARVLGSGTGAQAALVALTSSTTWVRDRRSATGARRTAQIRAGPTILNYNWGWHVWP